MSNKQESAFAWVERAAQRRSHRRAQPPTLVNVPSDHSTPICGERTVLWPDVEHLDVVCHLPAGHDSDTDDDHIEHVDEGGSLSWCTPVTRSAKESSMTADEVRAIVREEIREAFKVLQVQAGSFPGYETDTIEDGAAHVLGSVAESTADRLRHAPGCKLRSSGGYYWDCDCGLEES